MAGSSVYPGALDNFSNNSPTNLGDNDSTGRTHSERHDDVEASVEAVQSELGLNPSGDFATVDARLDDIEGDVSALDSDVTVLQGDVSTLESDVTVLQGDVVDAAGSVVVLRNELVGFGSVLDPLPPRTPAGEQLLKQSVLWLDAAHNSAGDQTVKNLGWGGSALNAQNGSTTGADSNDALFLDWTGENYVYLPGVAGNFLSVPDEAALDITGDIDIRAYVALDDWTPALKIIFVSKYATAANLSYAFNVAATGELEYRWSADGTNAVATLSSSVVTGFADGSSNYVRVTHDVNNGASGNDVKFFTSTDGVTWTQLGITRTTAGVTSIFSGTSPLQMANPNYGTALTGKVYRAQILNGIDGTKVLDVDTSVITSGAATSFTALTGQTVTIERSTAGRKAVAVVSPVWLFGTDDYMEVADNDLIDFGAADSFTVLAVIRQWATPASNGTLVQKASATNTNGYVLRQDGTTFQVVSTTHDGTNTASEFSAAASAGLLASWSFTVNRATQLMTVFLNGAAAPSPASTSSVGSLVNSEVLRIGRRAGAGTNYQDFELLAVAVFRRALTAGEITTITNYYSNRIGE